MNALLCEDGPLLGHRLVGAHADRAARQLHLLPRRLLQDHLVRHLRRRRRSWRGQRRRRRVGGRRLGRGALGGRTALGV